MFVCVLCVCVEDPFCVSELLIFLSSLKLVLGQRELALQKGMTSMMTAKKKTSAKANIQPFLRIWELKSVSSNALVLFSGNWPQPVPFH